MRTTTALSPVRALSLLAAGLMLVVAMMGQALLLPLKASADPALTDDEIRYVTLLAQGPPDGNGAPIVPLPGTTYKSLANGGRAIAYDLRHGVSPIDEARWIYNHTDPNFTVSMAEWEVVSAIVVFAPEFIPAEAPSGGFQT